MFPVQASDDAWSERMHEPEADIQSFNPPHFRLDEVSLVQADNDERSNIQRLVTKSGSSATG